MNHGDTEYTEKTCEQETIFSVSAHHLELTDINEFTVSCVPPLLN
jgi:hypothetical protein